MTKLDDIPDAQAECVETPEDETSRKAALIRKLKAAGHRPIAIGRAIVTIERCDSLEEVPKECRSPDALKLSFYPDPDVSGHENPDFLYIEGSRFGQGPAHYQVLAGDGRQRVFEMEGRLVRSEF
jgi:hypothetical protein